MAAPTLPINLPDPKQRGIGEVKLYAATYVAPIAGVPAAPPATGAGACAYVGALTAGGLAIDTGDEHILYETSELYGALAADRVKSKCTVTGSVMVISRESKMLMQGHLCTTTITTSVSTIACTRLVTVSSTVTYPLGNSGLNSEPPAYQWVISVPAPSTSSVTNLKSLIQVWKGVPRITGPIQMSKGGYAELPFEVTGLEDTDISAAALAADLALSRFGTVTDATA